MGISRINRVEFLLDGVSERDLPDRISVARHILEVLAGCASRAHIDGFTDVTDLPHDVIQALALLRGMAPIVEGRWRRPERTHMAIPVDLNERSQREAFFLFGPYAIHTELLYQDNSPLAVFHDASGSIEIVIDPADLTTLVEALPEGSSLRRVR